MALALKIGYFIIERAAEPVSNVIEQYAAQSPRFTAACVRVANFQARQEYNRDVRRLAQEQRVSEISPEPGRGHWVPADDLMPPPELSEREATQKGAEVLGEAIVLSVGLGLLLFQNASDRRDEAEQEESIERNEARIGEMARTLAKLEGRLTALEQQQQTAAATAVRPQQQLERRSRWWSY